MMIDSNNRPVKVVNDMMDKGNFNNNRIRIFRKLVRRDDGSIQEVNLSNLDRSIITQMMNEYSKFLSVTNDSVYENTGAQRKSEHTDVYNGAETFFNFSKTIDKNIYWRLRNKYGSNEGIEGKNGLKIVILKIILMFLKKVLKILKVNKYHIKKLIVKYCIQM